MLLARWTYGYDSPMVWSSPYACAQLYHLYGDGLITGLVLACVQFVFSFFCFRSEFQVFRFISLAQRLTVPKVDHLASELIDLVPRTFSLGVWAGHERHSRKEADSEPSWQALKRRGDWVEYAREVPHTNHKIFCDKEIICIYFRKCII